MTPVDGARGLVSVSSPSGGANFQVPDPEASVSGVAFNSDASIAYVANHNKECVYAFARPANGWLSGDQAQAAGDVQGIQKSRHHRRTAVSDGQNMPAYVIVNVDTKHPRRVRAI